jgi:hypothetical protein
MGSGKGVHSVPVDNPVEGSFRPFKRVIPGFPEISYAQGNHRLRSKDTLERVNLEF